MQATTNETQFGLVVDVVVEIRRVGSRWYQHHDLGAWLLRFIVTFLHPCGNGSAVWWVAKHRMTLPILCESIIFSREILRAFVVFSIGARVKREVELTIQFVKERLRCCPQVGGAAEYSCRQSAFPCFRHTLAGFTARRTRLSRFFLCC